MTTTRPQIGRPLIIFAGLMPPPVNGFSVMNEAVASFLTRTGFEVISISKLLRNPLLRQKGPGQLCGTAVVAALLSNLSSKGKLVVYLGVSGGKRQVIDLLLVLIARMLRARIFLHHHSFAYIRHPTSLATTLFRAASGEAEHVVLCERMASDLKRAFPSVKNVTPVSNVAFLAFPTTPERGRVRIENVLFLSNISLAKGISRFVDVLDLVRKSGVVINGIVAGPIGDRESSEIVKQAVETGLISYVGPVYEEAKNGLLSNCDVLLFPTSYDNEAEPVVVLEALASGMLVLSSSRGCIPEQLGGSGRLIGPDGSDIRVAAEALIAWAEDEDEFTTARQMSAAAWAAFVARATASRLQLIVRLTQGAGA